MSAFIKICSVHTPSSNPNKPPALKIGETLRRRVSLQVLITIMIWRKTYSFSLKSRRSIPATTEVHLVENERDKKSKKSSTATANNSSQKAVKYNKINNKISIN